MKKFYELPVVEITVFDVEDVITVSATSTLGLEGETLQAFLTDVESQYGEESGGTVVAQAYPW